MACMGFVFWTALMMGAATSPNEADLLVKLKTYFETEDRAREAELVREIEANPAYDRQKLGQWLHGMNLWRSFKPGTQEIKVDVGHGQTRRITLRIPAGYKPGKPWPLIYAMHPSGGTGPAYLSSLLRDLGRDADMYIIAAPTHYHQTVIDAPPPFTQEHPIMLRAIRQRVHVDSDRIYVMGRSLGGYTAWTMAILHADLFAASIPISATYSLPIDVEGLWQAMASNFNHLPILHIWGGRDGLTVPGFEGRNRNTGGMSQINRIFSKKIKDWGLKVDDHMVPGGGHGGYRMPHVKIERMLQETRVHFPKKVHIRFRHLHQASAYWLEGNTWQGPAWDRPGIKIKPEKGENRAQANGRVILPLLGELRGSIQGQVIQIKQRHLSEVTLWLGDGMINWDLPVTVKTGDKPLFQGQLKPSLATCLARAKATMDFNRLCWASLNLKTAP